MSRSTLLVPNVIKIAMIGAGSVVFSKNLTGDILAQPEFAGATISYMDIDPQRLEVAANLGRKVGQALGANPRIEATTDRKTALAGADFVINMIQVGGIAATQIDFEIPRKYGLNFTIADTTGPGGLFRALRTFPVLREICDEMAQVCPNAWLLNYSNPMSMNMRTIAHCGRDRAVGLCHSVQGTLNQLCWYMQIDPKDVVFTCAGINHMAFYLRLEKDGQDLYPRLVELADRFDIYNTNKVRFELMKRLGFYVTESSEHNAEYSAHFIPHGGEHIARFDVPIDEYLRRCKQIGEDFQQLKSAAGSDAPIHVNRTQEYAAPILRAMVNNTPTVIYGNTPNCGAIANLPDEAISEGPVVIDLNGMRRTIVGSLPPQLLGYIQPHLIQHELFLRAAVEGRRDHVYQAVMFDPLSAATLQLDEIVQMCDELIAAHGDLLPALR
jgi:alpha-galactosidase